MRMVNDKFLPSRAYGFEMVDASAALGSEIRINRKFTPNQIIRIFREFSPD
jgi:hypothetical protein